MTLLAMVENIIRMKDWHREHCGPDCTVSFIYLKQTCIELQAKANELSRTKIQKLIDNTNWM